MVSLGQYVANCWLETFPPKTPNVENEPSTFCSKICSTKLVESRRKEDVVSCVEFLPKVEPFVDKNFCPINEGRECSWDVWFVRNCCCPPLNRVKTEDKQESEKQNFRSRKFYRFFAPKRRQVFVANVRFYRYFEFEKFFFCIQFCSNFLRQKKRFTLISYRVICHRFSLTEQDKYFRVTLNHF